MIVVTAAIIEWKGLVLTARRGKGKHLEDYWEFPGGKLERNESPEQCLERELKEEFNVVVSAGSFFHENTHQYDEKMVKLLAYQVTHISGYFDLIDHDKILWLAPEDLKNLGSELNVRVDQNSLWHSTVKKVKTPMSSNTKNHGCFNFLTKYPGYLIF